MTRQIWVAMLAKLVAPLEPERAAKAITPMLAMLAAYPDGAFTPESARAVCLTGRVLVDGSLAPLGRVPTYGELELALGRWWLRERQMIAVREAPVAREALPAPPPIDPIAQEEAQRRVRSVVAAFQAERLFNNPKPYPVEEKASPRYLGDQHLLVKYEAMAQQGLPGAATRLAALRKKLATDRA